jgi:hypothetical protein
MLIILQNLIHIHKLLVDTFYHGKHTILSFDAVDEQNHASCNLKSGPALQQIQALHCENQLHDKAHSTTSIEDKIHVSVAATQEDMEHQDPGGIFKQCHQQCGCSFMQLLHSCEIFFFILKGHQHHLER